MSSFQLATDSQHQFSSRAIDGCLTPNAGESAFKMSNTSLPTTINMTNTKDSQINNNNNDNNNNGNLFNHSNTDIVSSVAEMPSPPLSPYARPSSTFDESDTRFAQLVFPKPTSSNSKINLSAFESDEESIDVEHNKTADKKIRRSLSDGANPNTNDKKRSFPIEDLSSTSLYINPYNDLKTPGYKRRQLKFLSQYKLVSPKFSVKKSINSAPIAVSSTTSSRFNTIPRGRFYNFNSSDTESEKPRTRRLVRESSVALESDDSSAVISRPSTPKKRKPTVRRVDSPTSSGFGSNSATPQPYSFNYKLIPDYSPPLTSLPNNNRCLKTEWKGQPMDLSTDPLVNELHPAEISLAATLRLPCNVYLDSKRRLFSEKVTRLKRHLPFRRTDAQKACKIDVNKASRLFASFEKVGWLKDSNFTQYI